jgi:hypothetical protein
MKTTSEVVSEVGIPRQKLYYLERKYLKQGFRYRAAYERALEELKQPRLL